MIKTERQYTATKAQLAKMSAALHGSAPVTWPEGIDSRFADIHRRAMESQIADLQAEIEEYDALRSGARPTITASSLADLPRALIQARIASGLTQRALADRLQMAEQQVQRYEASEYSSTSFSRLREIASALNIDVSSVIVSSDLLISPQQFIGRLKEIGLDREFVLRKVLPLELASTLRQALEEAPGAITDVTRNAVTRAGALLARVLGITVSEFFSSAPLRLVPAAAGGLRYKQNVTQAERNRQRMRDGEREVDAYTVYAHYLALLLIDTVSDTPVRPLPADPRELRRLLLEEYADQGGLTLKAALEYAWDSGIPVLPLAESGRFHGACWRVQGRNVIVLKQRTRSAARWLFDLLHELRHAGQHPHISDFGVIERDSSTEAQSQASMDEEDAMQFAGDVILAGRAEELVELAVDAAGGSVGRLKNAVPRIARREGVDVEGFANYLAHRLAKQGVNWWGTANNLQLTASEPFGIARDVFLERANLTSLNPTDRQLLLGALG